MIDENNDCFTKSKLSVTVKTLSNYNDWSRVAVKQKQTNRLRDTKTDKHLGRKHTKGTKDIFTNRPTRKLTVDTRTERVNQKLKMNI